MLCPVCGSKMKSHFIKNEYLVMKCCDQKCQFVGLDLKIWKYPYSERDYYEKIQ